MKRAARGPVAIGVDSGGTFTDFTTEDGRVVKVPSDAKESGRVMAQGIGQLLDPAAGATSLRIVHGTTVATNALLTGDLPKAAFLTTAGFRDLLAIGRQNRPNLYALSPERSYPAPDDALVFEIPERLDEHGRVVKKIDESAVHAAAAAMKKAGVGTAAIGFLHAYRDPRHERRAAAILESHGIRATSSADLVREYREFERFSTTFANAALVPLLLVYIDRLGSHFPEIRERLGGDSSIEIFLMQSSGGLCSAALAAEEPVRLVLSGPAGGLVGAFAACGRRRRKLITFDMGGTSTDVALIDGELSTTGQTTIAGRPLLVPCLDVHTVGAGGGSIARKDSGDALIVGPESAGANPGPAAYGRGGPMTVTDANLYLGRIVPEQFLGGTMSVDPKASRRALEALAKSLRLDPHVCAEGILSIAETTMARAVRTISLERGHDPREFALVAFGGAGALHAAKVAEMLGIGETVVPTDPGLLSAKGMLAARAQTELSRTVLGASGETIDQRPEEFFDELLDRARARLSADGVAGAIRCERFADLRFVGQSYELTVPIKKGRSIEKAFRDLHQKRWGFCLDAAIEVVNVRVRAFGPEMKPKRKKIAKRIGKIPMWGRRPVVFDSQKIATPIFERGNLGAGFAIDGPAVIVEYSATTVVPPDHRLTVEDDGLLVISAEGARAAGRKRA